MDSQNHLNHLNLPLHSNFAAPILCKDLMDAGLTDATLYHWKIQNGDACIWTSHFDPDGYYNIASSIIDAHVVTTCIPAYSAADIEKLVGDFIHIVKAGQHEVTPCQHNRIGMRKAPRYADALALIAIELLKRRIIQPNVASQIITH